MDKISYDRRRILALGATIVGLSLLPDTVLASVATSSVKTRTANSSRTLFIKALNTNEVIKSTYFVNGHYDKNELKRLDQLFRDRRSGDTHKIDPKLYDQLYQLNKKFGLDKHILLICGYRTPVTNKTLRSSSKSVAKNSLHMQGKAVDFRIEGVSLADLMNAAMDMNLGGVGYYPSSNFVHIDTGGLRAWPAKSIAMARRSSRPQSKSSDTAIVRRNSAGSSHKLVQ